MLLRYQVSNFRSIMDAIEISMVAVDEERSAARRFELLAESVLTVAGIYGPNASGKSNVVSSLAWLSSAVRHSLLAWEKKIPREPFRFGHGPRGPSTFEVDMTVRGVRYSYALELDDSSVIFEALYSYPERRRRTLFERSGMDLQLRRGLGAISGARELLTPTTLALSAATRFSEPEVTPFGRQLGEIMTQGIGRRPRVRSGSGIVFVGGGRVHSPSTEKLFLGEGDEQLRLLFDDESPPPMYGRREALALLRFADMGISDVHLAQYQEPDNETRRRIMLVHRTANEEIPFELGDESEGTQMWFSLIGPVLMALRRGRLLLFDEIDASLHPRLTARLVELFQDPEMNPGGAQLVFTTHDTSLLNVLNRDEVWLTEKGEEGATSLTALAEYGGDKVRRSLNLERAYLQGRFGAVPEFDQVQLKHALGMDAFRKSDG